MRQFCGDLNQRARETSYICRNKSLHVDKSEPNREFTVFAGNTSIEFKGADGGDAAAISFVAGRFEEGEGGADGAATRARHALPDMGQALGEAGAQSGLADVGVGLGPDEINAAG